MPLSTAVAPYFQVRIVGRSLTSLTRQYTPFHITTQHYIKASLESHYGSLYVYSLHCVTAGRPEELAHWENQPKIMYVPVSFHSHYYNHSAQWHNGLYGQFSILQCHDHAIPDFTFLFRKLRMTTRPIEKASNQSEWSTKPWMYDF